MYKKPMKYADYRNIIINKTKIEEAKAMEKLWLGPNVEDTGLPLPTRLLALITTN